MKQEKGIAQTYWVGIDWGKCKHAVCVVDTHRTIVREFTIPATLEGFALLAETLRNLGHIGGVAIESTHNPVLYRVLDEGHAVYPINPKLSKQWREGTSVAGVKSDMHDGRVLAFELARRHEQLRRLCPTDPFATELLGLCNKQRVLIDQRTALVQQMRESLGGYYPAALDFFRDLTRPTAWAFVKRFPNPQSLSSARKDTLLRFLRAHQIGLKPTWLERIEQRQQACEWPTPPDALAQEALVLACIAQLQAVQAHIDRFDRIIAERTRSLPQAKLIRSLPGAGPRLTPALTAMVICAEVEGQGVAALRCLTGIAPVKDESGKRIRTRIRRRCNKHWRNIMHLFAWSSTNFCRWAKVFYNLCKQRGDSNATALRKLADKWLRIIHSMLQTGQLYDEARYLESLRHNHSPLWPYLCG